MKQKLTHTLLVSLLPLFALNLPVGGGLSPYLLIEAESRLERNFGLSEGYSMSDQTIVQAIDRLERCECYKDADGRCVDNYDRWDVHSLSYGRLQFKEGTFVGYAKQYGVFPHAEDIEIMNFIYDGDAQRYVAYRMIEEDWSNLNHWKNCAVDLGLL